MRAAVALCLPFVTEVWQVYVLIFVLQSASAGFTPTFQATIPDVLPEEERYTRALSLSRLAYDLESLASPMLAALVLAFVSYDALFLGTVAGFLASAGLVVSVLLPSLNMARRASYKTKCLSNMRQLGDAYKLYQLDNKGWWPPMWQQYARTVEDLGILWSALSGAALLAGAGTQAGDDSAVSGPGH